MRKLGGLSLQEFLARRRVEKQVADSDRSSRRQAGFLDLKDLAAVDLDHSARFLVGSAGLQVQARYRSNRGQSLTTKPKRGYAEQVFGVLDFRRRVTFESKQSVVTDHATSVIGNLDELLASSFDLNLDARGTCVE